jgi:acetyl-CoA synthetase
MRNGLDVRPHDVFWNAADPGWAYGLYYALIGPMLMGKPVMFSGVPFDPQTITTLLRRWQVTNFAAAPTVYRSIRAAGHEIWSDDPIRLRAASSAGESLNADLQVWANKRIGTEIYDHYGQTELGMVVMNHHHPELRRPLRANSMGHSTPGYRAVILDEDGRESGPDRDGHLAIDTEQSPLYWFRGYFGEEARTADRFPYGNRYYVTGDLARTDSEGYFFSRGRADDVISCAGYRIGPFEIESVLQSHPAVAEAAVVGKHDDLRGEIVKAFVVLHHRIQPSAILQEELAQFVKTRFAAHAYPKEIEFRRTLPRTLSGKLQRYLLRDNP